VSPRLRAAAFTVVMTLCSPIFVAGYVLWVGKMFASRRSGVSGTAQGPLSARSFQHQLGVRPDEASHRILLALPNVSPLAVRLASWPLVFASRVTGHVPRTFEYPFRGDVPPSAQAAARVGFYDAAVERHLADGGQLVLLGAGFDTRALRFGGRRGVRAFEVDRPATQATKREVLARAGIDASAVTFVSADFGREDWFERLLAAGFDRARPAVFLWEGVTVYLTQEDVEATLRRVASCAPGSILVFDYFSTEALTSKAPYWRYARWATDAAGEPLRWGVDSRPPGRERVAELLDGCGLRLVDAQILGPETEGRRSWGGFVVAGVPPG
jgi:methyltransferase (TIGR00027 family)